MENLLFPSGRLDSQRSCSIVLAFAFRFSTPLQQCWPTHSYSQHPWLFSANKQSVRALGYCRQRTLFAQRLKTVRICATWLLLNHSIRATKTVYSGPLYPSDLCHVEIEGAHPYHFHRTVYQASHSFIDTWSPSSRRFGPDRTVRKKPHGKNRTDRSDG